MKLWPSILVAVFLCSIYGRSQVRIANRPFDKQQGEHSTQASLQLTTSVVDQLYCSDGHVRMFLKLSYTNIGSDSIILKKNSFAIARSTVSRSEKAAAKRAYEKVANFFYAGIVQPNPAWGFEPSKDRFVILAPGDSYEVDTKEVFHDLRTNNYFDVTNLRTGVHFLEISVNTWEEDVSLARELSVVWHEHGVLWWKGVTSRPMSFKIEKPSFTIKCS